MTNYTVKPGDDLSKIALAFYGDGSDANGQKIYEANKAVIGGDKNFLRPGQVCRYTILLVPRDSNSWYFTKKF